jgi:hypothetical protein
MRFMKKKTKKINVTEKVLKKVLRRQKGLKKETGIAGYKSLVTSQEIIREVGRYLDKFIFLAPEMEMFAIDTPRNSFSILCRKRFQKVIE